MNSILKESLNIDWESFNLTLISKDKEAKDLKKISCKPYQRKKTLERENKIKYSKKNILNDKLLILEDQLPLCLSARNHHVY